MLNNQVQIMGVINLTPNSFSDGGEHLSFDSLKAKVKSFTTHDNHIIDIGVESTAPFNDAITYEQEIERLDKYFFSALDDFKTLGVKTFSFDTYRPLTMIYVLDKLKGHDFDIIWNDVSGVVDDELIELLNVFPNLKYILSHNLAGKRAFSGEHMDYVDPNLEPSDVMSFFESRLKKLAEAKIDLSRIWCDPCFGFSKTAEQNYMLLERLGEFSNFYPRWLIGISRKSFLQRLVPGFERLDREERLFQSEKYHVDYLVKVLNILNDKQVILRVHDIKSLSFLQ